MFQGVGLRIDWVLGGKMGGVAEWVGWENEWAALHML